MKLRGIERREDRPYTFLRVLMSNVRKNPVRAKSEWFRDFALPVRYGD